MDALYLFLFFSIISLAMQIVEDIKTLKIDSRRNFYMYGCVITLALITGLNWSYLICVVLVLFFGVALSWYERKINKKLFGEGDQEIFYWIIPGCVLFGSGLLFPAVYLLGFALSVGVIGWLNSKYKIDYLPGTIPIALAFFMTMSFYFLYFNYSFS